MLINDMDVLADSGQQCLLELDGGEYEKGLDICFIQSSDMQ